MTKQEKIKEAWNKIGVSVLFGVCIDTGYSETRLKDNIGELLDYHSIAINDIQFEQIGHGKIRYRPYSLKGLEHNNNWIKIESVHDLPKENGLYFVSFTLKGELNSTNFRDFHVGTEDSNFWMANYSHYQPIKMPETPIY